MARLSVDHGGFDKHVFRVDTDIDANVLAIDGRLDWKQEIAKKFDEHRVVVTHNFDRNLIAHDFPNANLIAIYPYTHLGNVLYNICYKKLTIKLPNAVDNHYIHLHEWHNKILQCLPGYQCFDYWELKDLGKIQTMLDKPMTSTQQDFFTTYWGNQLPLELNFPNTPMTINDLLDLWRIRHVFNNWLVALVIYVHEQINGLSESDRSWSINDADKFTSWQDIIDNVTEYQLQGR